MSFFLVAGIYILFMIYLFLGVSILADVFMESVEVRGRAPSKSISLDNARNVSPSCR
jgi:hypothetical protein